MSTAERPVRQSVSLPPGIARRVKSLAKSSRTSANRPISDTDTGFRGSTGSSVTFPDLKKAQGETNPESLKGDTLQANLIFPEPTHFLSKRFPPVSIIRPTSIRFSGAVAAVKALAADGLFIGHTVNGKSDGLVALLLRLALQADEARREST